MIEVLLHLPFAVVVNNIVVVVIVVVVVIFGLCDDVRFKDGLRIQKLVRLSNLIEKEREKEREKVRG